MINSTALGSRVSTRTCKIESKTIGQFTFYKENDYETSWKSMKKLGFKPLMINLWQFLSICNHDFFYIFRFNVQSYVNGREIACKWKSQLWTWQEHENLTYITFVCRNLTYYVQYKSERSYFFYSYQPTATKKADRKRQKSVKKMKCFLFSSCI